MTGDPWETFSGAVERREKAARRFRSRASSTAAVILILASAWVVMVAAGALGRSFAYSDVVVLATAVNGAFWFVTSLALNLRHDFTKREMW